LQQNQLIIIVKLSDFSQIIYLIIAVAAWYYPDPDVATSNGGVLQLAGQNINGAMMMVPGSGPLSMNAQV
jgi:hypothetical protein